jgi:hypothetical protein
MRKIENMIRKFVSQVEPNVRVIFHDGDMESDSLNAVIYINVDEFLYTFSDEKNHLQIMRENGLLTDILVPTFIVLHEIGHVATARNYKTKRVFDQYEKQVDGLVKRYKGLELLRKYKGLKVEREADKFAYNYYLHNYNFVKDFDNQIRALL